MSLSSFIENYPDLTDENTQAILREETLIELFKMMVFEGLSIKKTFGVDIGRELHEKFVEDQYIGDYRERTKLRNYSEQALETYLVTEIDKFTGMTRVGANTFKTRGIEYDMYELERKWYKQIFEPPVDIQDEQPMRQLLWYYVDRYYVLGGSNYELKELFNDPIDDLFHVPESIEKHTATPPSEIAAIKVNRTREEMLRRRAERKGVTILESRNLPDEYDNVCKLYRDRFDKPDVFYRQSKVNQRLPRSEQEFELCRPSISTHIFPHAELFAWDTTSGRRYRETHDAANYFLTHLTPTSNAQRMILLIKLEERWKEQQKNLK